jgi:tetratricopeptide (TPR) repeat protein
MERIEQLKAFLSENPADPFLTHALALEHIKMGDDETARTLFENLLSADPAYVGSYYHLAKLFERRGDVKAAEGWYLKGIEAARHSGDRHALGELVTAYDDLAG